MKKAATIIGALATAGLIAAGVGALDSDPKMPCATRLLDGTPVDLGVRSEAACLKAAREARLHAPDGGTP